MSLSNGCDVGHVYLNGEKRAVRWRGNPLEPDNHRHDYRFIQDSKERDAWIRKYWKFVNDTKD